MVGTGTCSKGLERCGRGGWKARGKGLKIREFFSESVVSERDKEKRKEEKKEKRGEKRRKHFRGTNVISEFGLSFVNAIFMTEN